MLDHLQDPQTLCRRYATFSLDVSTVWMPDSFEPEAHAPVELLFALHADHLTWLSTASRCFVPVTHAQRAAFLDAAQATARAGHVRPGVDTAIGRYLTRASLRVELPMRLDGHDTLHGQLEINDAAYHRPPAETWGRLFGLALTWLGGDLTSEERARLVYLGANEVSY